MENIRIKKVKVINKSNGLSVSIVLVFFAAALLAGCSKEQSVDEYNHEQVQREAAKAQAVKGVYRGVVVSKKDQSPIGELELTVSPKVQAATGGSHPYLDQQITIEGVMDLTLATGEHVNFTFENGSFDSSTQRMVSSTSVTLSNNTPAQLEVNGNFSAQEFNGEIQVSTEEGGSFKLIKNGPTPGAASLQGSKTVRRLIGLSKDYEGVGTFYDGTTSVLQLTIDEPANDPREAFMNVFKEVKIVSISIKSKHSVIAAPTMYGTWDYRTNGGLTGHAGVQTNGPYFSIDCHKTNGGAVVPGADLPDLDCTYKAYQLPMPIVIHFSSVTR